MDNVQRIFVCGSGLMGSGIAQVAAQGGFSVTMYDIGDEPLQRGMAAIRDSLDRFVRREVLTEAAKEETLARLQTTRALADAATCDLVIEAVPENFELKKQVFAELDNICPENVVFATNTSAIPITRMAAVTNRPDQFVGMHFFSPVPLMKLVEIVRGERTSDETVQIAEAVGRRMGKEPVVVARDFGGFLANRIGLPYMRAAIVALTEGVASAADIDKGMRLGFGMPMGPLELADLTGLDVLMHSLEAIAADLEDASYAPPPLLKRMVEAGKLGRKTGIGFYRYDERGKRIDG